MFPLMLVTGPVVLIDFFSLQREQNPFHHFFQAGILKTSPIALFKSLGCYEYLPDIVAVAASAKRDTKCVKPIEMAYSFYSIFDMN